MGINNNTVTWNRLNSALYQEDMSKMKWPERLESKSKEFSKNFNKKLYLFFSFRTNNMNSNKSVNNKLDNGSKTFSTRNNNKHCKEGKIMLPNNNSF